MASEPFLCVCCGQNKDYHDSNTVIIQQSQQQSQLLLFSLKYPRCVSYHYVTSSFQIVNLHKEIKDNQRDQIYAPVALDDKTIPPMDQNPFNLFKSCKSVNTNKCELCNLM